VTEGVRADAFAGERPEPVKPGETLRVWI